MKELRENYAAGAALAALEMQKATILLLMRHSVLPVDLTLAMIDLSLQQAEKMDAALRAAGTLDEAAQWRAARFHIEAFLAQCRALKAQIASAHAPGSSSPGDDA